MASTLSSFTFLSIVMVLSVLLRPSSSGAPALIHQICGQAQDFGHCHRFFHNRVTSPASDITELCHIALNESISLIENTHTLIQILRAHEHDRNVQDLYWICESAYEILTDQLVSADSAFGAGDYRNMVFYMESCDRFVRACEKVIGSQVARLSKRNMKAREFIRISLAAGGILKGDHS